MEMSALIITSETEFLRGEKRVFKEAFIECQSLDPELQKGLQGNPGTNCTRIVSGTLSSAA